MFEGLSDGDLIDVMGEATRDESTAIAQRLAAVAQLYVRRSGALAEWTGVVPMAVMRWPPRSGGAAHQPCPGGGSGAVRLRVVASAAGGGQGLRAGVIDFRVVSTIVSRTENVDEAVMPQLDDAIARHAEKWMRLRARSCAIGWISGWPSSTRPGCGCRPRSTTTAMSTSIRPARAWPALSGTVNAADGAALDHGWRRWRPPCAKTIRAPKNSAAPTPAGRWRAGRPPWPANADQPTARPQRNSAARTAAAVIHVLAEQATLDGTSDSPAICPGSAFCPPSRCASWPPPPRSSRWRCPTGATPDPGYRPGRRRWSSFGGVI